MQVAAPDAIQIDIAPDEPHTSPMPLTSTQRDHLKKLAHHVKPTVYVGKQGVTDTVVRTTAEVLAAHELIKVKFVDRKDEKRALIDDLTGQTSSYLVGILGHVATLFKPNPDLEKRRIPLPGHDSPS
ncbi:MAG: YhbY family RNA-binding protein [Candidatus Hydrogenedentes bacterium]|nr:YhbY family RNA-binding protein [Candidatus Hydrogenedentota bacterium]